MTTWTLAKGADRRVRQGHPWVFSNELSHSPKGHPAGEAVELRDHRGQFVAYGYGNPHSLIAFRVLSFRPEDREIATGKSVRERILAAWKFRHDLFYPNSFRLVFGEGDQLPGLVIDLYKILPAGDTPGDHSTKPVGQVLAVQILTAGMQNIIGRTDEEIQKFFSNLIEDAFEKKLSHFDFSKTTIVLRNDVNIRKLEGLNVEESRVLVDSATGAGVNLRHCDIAIDSAADERPLLMRVDLVDGQKTGFFLDQSYNIRLFAKTLERSWQSGVYPKTNEGKSSVPKIKVLDLCCYVGQWSTHLARLAQKNGVEIEITQVDVSEPALALAKINAEREGAKVISKQLDVFEGLGALVEKYDVVIADPPALIKNKKDMPTGTHAYLKINTHAFRLTQLDGWTISCSCSGLFTEQDFVETLRKAQNRNQIAARLVRHGGHSPDHPILMQWSEGFYLKMFVHKLSQ